MNRRVSFLLLFVLAFLVGCDKYDSLIQDLDDRIEILEGNSIPEIAEQIKEVNASLNDLTQVDAALDELIENLNGQVSDLQQQINDNASADAATKKLLEDKITALEALIKQLQDRDSALDQQIKDLKSYVDDENKSAKEWSNATFATLEHYATLQTQLSKLSALIESNKTELKNGYTSAIEKSVTDMLAAISTSETSMKGWVNETLADGYYNIAQIDAYLYALETKLAQADADLGQEDAKLAEQIEAQKTALEQAKTDLKDAYEAAIIDAIEEHNGVFTNVLADAIKGAKDELEIKIKSINDEITSIKSLINNLSNRIDNIETRIQSIRFLPQFSDGKVEFTYENAPVIVNFMVTPKQAALSVAQAFEIDNAVLTAGISRSQPRSRAVDTPAALTVTSVTATDVGMLTVTIDPSSLSADYWSATKDANLFICINDGNNYLISELIPVFYTPQACYVWTNGIEASVSVNGKGTSKYPYLIESANDLQWMIEQVNDNNLQRKYYKLTHDLEINSNEQAPWIPIGSMSMPFVGFFDGDGHTISGEMVVANEVSMRIAGFFGSVGLGSIISNLTNAANLTSLLDGYDMSMIGGIAGYVEGHEEDYGCYNGTYIMACRNMGKITAGSNIYQSETGGIAGRISNGAAILACSNTGELVDENEYPAIGTIVGYCFVEGYYYEPCIVSCLYNYVDGVDIANGGYFYIRGTYTTDEANDIAWDDVTNLDNANNWIFYFNELNYDYQYREVTCDKHWEYENGSFVLKEGVVAIPY